jgi:SAM-dependent methyltransferase
MSPRPTLPSKQCTHPASCGRTSLPCAPLTFTRGNFTLDRYVTESVRGLLDRAGDAIANRGGADRLTHADVLDVGTGTGVVVRRLAERHPLWTFTGVDISDGMLDVAKAHLPRHTFVLAGAENLPFPNESFDVIVTLSSFHFWSDSERGLAEIRRVLRPGGLLVLSDWCHDFWACKLCAWYLWLTPGYSKVRTT